MQLLIDTDIIPMPELGALINYLDDILVIRRGKEEAPAPSAANDQREPLRTTGHEPTSLSPADIRTAINAAVPPPPIRYVDEMSTGVPAPPAGWDQVVSDNDPEVEFDNDGGVTALTVSAGAAPPPPPPPPVVYDTTQRPIVSNHVSIPAVPAPPGPVVAAELDVRGMPYDARIHASNRAKKIDGSWKNRRGVDAALVATIEAQNKPGNAPTPGVSTMVAPARPTASGAASPATSAGTAPPPPPPPPPTDGAVAPVAAVPSAIDFRGLMQKIQAASAAGKLSDEQVNTAFASVGLKPEDMGQLINNAPLIASVNAAIDAVVK